MKLFPTQEWARDGLTVAFARGNAALDCTVTGGGKSVHSLAVARAFGLKPFYVGPLSVCPAYADTMTAFGSSGEVINYERLRSKSCPWVKRDADGRVLSFSVPKNHLLIYDEFDAAVNHGTINSEIALAAKRSGAPMLLMSATLAFSPLHFGVVGEILDLHRGFDFQQFALRHGGFIKPITVAGGQTKQTVAFDPLTSKGRRGLESLHRHIFSSCGVRIRKEDIGGFPETVVTARMLDLGTATSAINRAYEEMILAETMLDLRKKLSDAEEQAVIVRRLRARQFVEMAKVPVVCDLVRAAFARGESVVIFLNFTETIERLKEVFSGIPFGVISGTTPDRHAVVKAFQSDQLRLLFIQERSGGAGLSLHDTHGRFPRYAIHMPMESIRRLVQCTGRICRLGGKTPSRQDILVTENTIETAVWKSLVTKSAGLDLFNDGNALGASGIGVCGEELADCLPSSLRSNADAVVRALEWSVPIAA